jgi:transcriptional regulator with GAF, ATPase, and Fis domain
MSSAFFSNPRSNPELKCLREIALLPRTPQLQDYFSGVMATLSQYFSVGYGALILQGPQKDWLQVEALYGMGKEEHPLNFSNRTGMIGKAFELKQPMAIHHFNQEPFYEEMAKKAKRIEKIRLPLLCCPLTAQDGPFGVINMSSLYGPRDEFTEDFQFLYVLSAVISPVIRNYQVKKEEPLAKPEKSKLRFSLLEEVLEDRLSEFLDKIAPYAESKARIGILDDIVAVVEKILIRAALRKVDNVQVAAAHLLGINRNTLRKKMKELKIKVR